MSNETMELDTAPQQASVKGCKGQHGEYGAIGTIVLQRPASEVYHFLTRIEGYPTWNTAVKHAQVVKSTKVAEDVEVKHVQQVMRWGFLALRGDFTLQLSMRENARAMTVHTEMTSQAPTRTSSGSSSDGQAPSSPVSSRSGSFSSDASNSSGSNTVADAVDGTGSDQDNGSRGGGGFMKRFSSRMTVQELGPDRASLEMEMYMLPSIFVPFGIRSLVGHQVRRQLGGLLHSVKTHVESPDYKPTGSGSSSSSSRSRSQEESDTEVPKGRWAFAPAALMLAM